jgi:hypothetical protein
MSLVGFYVGEYVWVCVGVYTKSKTSELSPLRSKKSKYDFKTFHIHGIFEKIYLLTKIN